MCATSPSFPRSRREELQKPSTCQSDALVGIAGRHQLVDSVLERGPVVGQRHDLAYVGGGIRLAVLRDVTSTIRRGIFFRHNHRRSVRRGRLRVRDVIILRTVGDAAGPLGLVRRPGPGRLAQTVRLGRLAGIAARPPGRVLIAPEVPVDPGRILVAGAEVDVLGEGNHDHECGRR